MINRQRGMRIFYYQYLGKTYVVCVSQLDAGKNSPIWDNCNTCSWLVLYNNHDEE